MLRADSLLVQEFEVQDSLQARHIPAGDSGSAWRGRRTQWMVVLLVVLREPASTTTAPTTDTLEPSQPHSPGQDAWPNITPLITPMKGSQSIATETTMGSRYFMTAT